MKPATLLIDTNLLVLWVVGTAGRDYIAKHKRLTQFVAEDYDALVRIIGNATHIVVTPNILTETSNLAAYIAEPARTAVLEVLRQLILTTQEQYVSSIQAVVRREFIRLGLTDASIVELCTSGATLITTDLDLYLALQSAGGSAINYNHVRDDDQATN